MWSVCAAGLGRAVVIVAFRELSRRRPNRESLRSITQKTILTPVHPLRCR